MTTPKAKFAGLALIFVCADLNVSQAFAQVAEDDCSTFVVGQSFPCYLDTISWVEVYFQGDLLKKYKSEFETLIRLRLRNDLSMMKHEVKSREDIWKKHEFKRVGNFDGKKVLNHFKRYRNDMKRRGQVSCLVWTVGEDYPIALLVECTLSGWGWYELPGIWGKFESRILGYTSKSKAKDFVNDAIRDIITTISADFLNARDRVRSWKMPK